MSFHNFSKVCRACLTESYNMKSVFGVEQVMEYTSTVGDIMMNCASIQVYKGDGLPEQVCYTCIQEMNRAFLFRKLCEKTDVTLRSYCASIVPLQNVEKNSYLPQGETKFQGAHNVDIANSGMTDNATGVNTIVVNNTDINTMAINNRQTCNTMINSAIINNAAHNTSEINGEAHVKAVVNNITHSSIDNNINIENSSANEMNLVQVDNLTNLNVHKEKIGVKDEKLKMIFEEIENNHCSLDSAEDNVTDSESATEDSSSQDTFNRQNSDVTEQTPTNEKSKRSYICQECNITCSGLADYQKHMDKVHVKNIKCRICDKTYKSEFTLNRHFEVAHINKSTKLDEGDTDSLSDEPSIKDGNNKKTSQKGKTGIVKKRNLPRTCNICHKTFRFHSNLERHLLIHTGEKPFLCNVCGKGFAQMSYLKIHSFIHTGEKPYQCQICDKSFSAPGTLMTHIRTHTGERPHVCKICGKDFPQSGYLSAHIRTHTGEKPAECKVCHRRFNQSGRLVIHMRIHSGEKPYQCKDCGRSFAVKGTLKKHIRTHTGERPYICSTCGQAFAQSGTLATHMKIHSRPKT